MLPIKKKIIRYNYSGRNDEKIKYIVIHDTGNRARGADAEAHYRYFNSGNRGASAHYFVDDRSPSLTVRSDFFRFRGSEPLKNGHIIY
ncbi:hypothetical protein H0A61_00263 [Koleobacter methoxysyntrophicus]|uniref:N-acetylmuramoyl-L-alanine amidase domain-containing protein n=1 Tax=Koleobacter methoxysyntrophicus TaxID=2751313 RepID=A0A8A0RJS1_9FIRM|nr:N-acetylmuramoyl-L-alanine amidase [Koleobacter methoxysyntrophicus]QSQ07944.1 hypothetical protein H0A61_00263 [Koleobacter methoxysyntrophicus]